MRLRFGVFDQLDRQGGSPGELYEDRLALAEAYDRLGLDGYFISEHHGTPLGMAPSPGLFFAAVAQRTGRLRFGPLVYTLPMYEPLRLVEEICMLDHLSAGRFELGIGKGVSPIELGFFGTPGEEAQARYEDAWQAIRKGLTQATLDHEGPFYRYRAVPMTLAPLQKPHPPLWYGMTHAATADWAADNSVNVVLYPTAAAMREVVDRYERRWRAGRGARGAPMPAVALVRQIVIAPSRAEAEAVARRGYTPWWESLQHLWKQAGKLSPHHPERFEDAVAIERLIAGTPAEVAAEVARQVAVSGTNYFMARFAFGHIARAEALRSAALFAEHVMPAARAAMLAPPIA